MENDLDKLIKELESMDEKENLESIYYFLTKYRVKSSNIMTNLESGRMIFAHQKMIGLFHGLDYLRGRISLRLECLENSKKNENNKNL